MPQSAKGGHQIGLAMHNYHDAHGVFTPGVVSWYISTSSTSGWTAGPKTSWLTLLLPFIDETAMYNAYNFDRGAVAYGSSSSQAAANTTVCRGVIAQYLCPSDKAPSDAAWAESNYVGCAGNRRLCDHSATALSRGCTCGVLHAISQVRVRDIFDGTSNTIAAGECFTFREPASSYQRGRWAYGLQYYALRNTQRPLNWMGCTNTTIYDGCDYSTPGSCNQDCGDNCRRQFCSRHEGGAFFLMCDGQVRFLSENVDYTVYQNLSTFDNNEAIDDEDF